MFGSTKDRWKEYPSQLLYGRYDGSATIVDNSRVLMAGGSYNNPPMEELEIVEFAKLLEDLFFEDD